MPSTPLPRQDHLDEIQRWLEAAGLSLRREDSGRWSSSFDTWDAELPLSIRCTGHWLQLAVGPFLPSLGTEPDALREELLRLNRELRLAKFGVSPEGAVVLTAELPIENLDPSEVRAVVQALLGCIEEHRARLSVLPSPG